MDSERQEDELLAIESIYDASVFTTTHNKNNVEGMFQVHLDLPKNFHVLIYSDDGLNSNDITVEHLPPIVLRFGFSKNYPSEDPPWFNISCQWLNRHQLSTLCKELDRIWEENLCEILFTWIDFLKEETLSMLGITNSVDISHISKLRRTKSDKVAHNSIESRQETVQNYSQSGLKHNDVKEDDAVASKTRSLSEDSGRGILDKRVHVDLIHGALLLPSLIEHNHHRMNNAFNKQVYDCEVCFQQKFGYQSMKFTKCDHIYCRDCMSQYFTVKINDGNVNNLQCPSEKCFSTALPNQVRDLVASETYNKYDRMLLSSTLNTMNDIVYCPRVNCQCPVIADSGANLARCSSCCYAFCIYCQKAFHGIAPCDFNKADIKKLQHTYLHGTAGEKLALEKRHGKRNIQKVIEEALANDYIKENSQKCPTCRSNIEKTDGCNKMTCWNCNSHFCWLCNSLLDALHPYLHYNNPNRSCFNLLFHGANITDDEEDE